MQSATQPAPVSKGEALDGTCSERLGRIVPDFRWRDETNEGPASDSRQWLVWSFLRRRLLRSG